VVDADLIASKLSELADRVARVREHARPTAQELGADRDALELVSFNLMLAVQTCADIASHLIADEGWPPARNLTEGFERLAQHGVLEPATSRQLQKAVGLRNVVVHGYGHVDVGMVHAAATVGVGDLDAFARQVGGWVRAQPRSDS
jgi:uncharacterized protein YutE (UPF0331/DUF86 family)